MSPETVLDLRPVIRLGLMFPVCHYILVSVNYLMEVLLHVSCSDLNM